ncbi:MAG TPA: hypothetical protein IAA38_08250 [Candidatus Ruminococcus gallistercoris]|nr:hypothetical protein [Candidatus Ruminococcus gallistercoris]
MSQKEIEIVKNIAECLGNLPDDKKEYLLGYAEGVAAMAERHKQEEQDTDREEPPKKATKKRRKTA